LGTLAGRVRLGSTTCPELEVLVSSERAKEVEAGLVEKREGHLEVVVLKH